MNHDISKNPAVQQDSNRVFVFPATLDPTQTNFPQAKKPLPLDIVSRDVEAAGWLAYRSQAFAGMVK